MANRMHRVLVVGVGSIGERHLRCFQATGRAELSLCEVTPGLRQAVAVRYNVANAFAELAAGLEQRPDAVVIATPAPFHVPMALQAAAAGCHLLIEKPLSTSLDGIEELAALVAAKNSLVSIGYTWRSHPSLEAMRAAIADGRFGAPVELIVTSGQHFPTFRPAYRDIYFTRHETGGGAIQDGLTHMFNLGEWLLGPIDRLAADAAHLVLEGVDVEDTAHVLARHGRVLATYSMNLHQAPNETTVTVICERGTVRFESRQQRWRWLDMPEPNGQWRDEPHPPFDRDFLYVRQAEAFLDLLDGVRPPLCTLAEGIQTLKVNLAALRAAAEQNWQSI